VLVLRGFKQYFANSGEILLFLLPFFGIRKSLACWNGCAAMKSGRAAKSFIAVLWTCGYGTERFLIMSK
jgi:hypothetical protein